MTSTPAHSLRRRGKRWFLIVLKWCRISLLLLCLVGLVLGLFLNHVGLPDWLNRRVVEQFRAKGWELQYSRLRLRWYHGIVADDLQLERTNGWPGPHLFVPRAEFKLNWKAFRHLDLEANGAMLRGGRLVWPLPGTNQPRRTFLLGSLQGELLFLPNDVWDLKYLQAEILNARIRFRGDITNASLIREWKLPERPRAPEGVPGQFWHRLLTAVEQIQFEGQPELNVTFSGDAQNWKSFDAQARFIGLGVSSPWASGTNLAFTAHLLPSLRSNDSVRADIRLTSDQAHTPWGAATNVDLSMVFEPSFTHLLPTNTLALLELRGASNRWCQAERLVLEVRSSPTPTNTTLHLTSLDLSLDRLQSPQLDAIQTRVTATSLHPATNLLPAAIDSLWTMHQARSPALTAAWSQTRAKLEVPVVDQWRFAGTNRTWPERFDSLALNIRSSLSNVIAPHLEADRAGITLLWRAPLLELTVGADAADAQARFETTLHTETRELRFRTRAQLPPTRLRPFLDTNAQTWLAACQFDTPPRIHAEGRLLLPAWTNGLSHWRTEVLPTLEVSGELDLEAGSIRGVPWLSAQAPFAVTNLAWTLPDLKIFRPEGSVALRGRAEQRTGQFELNVQSDVNLLALRPAFPEPRAQGIFDYFEFDVPPWFRGEARGNWRDWTLLSGSAEVALTNSRFRGQAIKACTSALVYSNRFLSILRPVVLREGEQGQADGIGIDLKQQRLFLTNAVGRLAPRAVTKCIGPITDRTIAPYDFERPPFARVEGSVPLGESDGTENMRFEVDGGPFHWERFHLERIRATLLWRGDTLELTNVLGAWQGADVSGRAHFDFTPKTNEVFNFFVRLDNADLRRVLRDLQPGKTNKVEGTVNGDLHITSANTHDWQSWQGYGHIYLTNGMLWNTPLFSLFSPILNAFIPGLGNSRARHATATYQITNSIIYSHDLVIRGTALRMNYRGSVDFHTRLDGRMEAELLRDLPAFGFLFSKLLWPVTKLFDYKVSGTLEHPKTEEVYVLSKIIMIPLHPLKTLRDLLEQKVEEK